MAFSGHFARKRFGQHWLTDGSVLGKIIEASDLQPNDRVLEIGPGPGGVTRALLDSASKSIIVIEKDRRCLAILKDLQDLFEDVSSMMKKLGVKEEELKKQ